MKIKILVPMVLIAAGFGMLGWWLGHRAPMHVDHKPLYYQHPMRPEVHSPVPAKDEMGMDYVAVYEEAPSVEEASVPGRSVVRLTSDVATALSVRSVPVEVRPLLRRITTYGTVAFDPSLYNALAEYREAVRARDAVASSSLPEVRERANALVEGARLKLKLSGVRPGEMADDHGLLLGEKGGAVWVYAEIYGEDIASVRPGLAARISSPAIPGREYVGSVRSVDPTVNPVTRTARARIALTNADENLKPETFVDVAVELPLGMHLSVPAGAVIDTGERSYVYVESEPLTYVPRQVKVGLRAGDFVEVLEGVAAGESVATGANFLIDSESRFRAAAAIPGESAPAEHHHD